MTWHCGGNHCFFSFLYVASQWMHIALSAPDWCISDMLKCKDGRTHRGNIENHLIDSLGYILDIVWTSYVHDDYSYNCIFLMLLCLGCKIFSLSVFARVVLFRWRTCVSWTGRPARGRPASGPSTSQPLTPSLWRTTPRHARRPGWAGLLDVAAVSVDYDNYIRINGWGGRRGCWYRN